MEQKKAKNRINLFLDMDGVLAAWLTGATDEELHRPGYFAQLPPTSLAAFLQHNPLPEPIRKYALSAYFQDTAAHFEKRWWLSEYTDIPEARRLLIPCGASKAAYVREYFHRPLTKRDVLLDDYSANLLEWEEAGGTAVKWLNGINGSGKRFHGVRVSTPEELMHAILPLENG